MTRAEIYKEIDKAVRRISLKNECNGYKYDRQLQYAKRLYSAVKSNLGIRWIRKEINDLYDQCDIHQEDAMYIITSCPSYDGPYEDRDGIVSNEGCVCCKHLNRKACPYPNRTLTQRQFDSIGNGNDTWDGCEFEWREPKTIYGYGRDQVMKAMAKGEYTNEAAQG